VIVNAAYRRADWATTADGGMHVALAAAAAEARLVHVSSDAVFSGTAASCDESCLPEPTTPYGAAKAAAENGGHGCCSGCRHRPYLADIGDGDWAHERYVHALAAGAVTGALFTDDLRCPVHVTDLAAALLELAAGTVRGRADAMERAGGSSTLGAGASSAASSRASWRSFSLVRWAAECGMCVRVYDERRPDLGRRSIASVAWHSRRLRLVPDNGEVTDQICAQRGRVFDAHDRHVRFGLPDPVLDRSPAGLPDGTWMSHADPRTSVMMQVPGLGAFVRAAAGPADRRSHCHLRGVGGIYPRDLQRAFAVWWQPEYAGLRLDGFLANAVQPWGLLATPVSLVVRDPDQTPYCAGSPDPLLARVLTEQWPHADIIDALP
jgi:hypothetical protein